MNNLKNDNEKILSNSFPGIDKGSILSYSDPLLIDEEEYLMEKNGANLIDNSYCEELNNKKSIFQHQYLKEVILIYILFSLLIMSAMSYNLFTPNVLLDYVERKYPNYNENQVQSEAAYYKSFLDSIPYIFVFLFGPFIGVISDKYGRKFPLYFGCVIQILDMVSCYITVRTNSLIPYIIGHLPGGLFIVVVPAIYSYLSDLTDTDLLSTTFAFSGVAVGLAAIIGPGLVLVTTLFPNIFFLNLYISIGFIVISIIIIIFLKESLVIAKENNKIKSIKRSSNPFKLIKKVFSSTPYVLFVILIYVICEFCIQDVFNTYIYSTSLRYGWGSKQQSLYMIGTGVFMLIWSIIIVPQLLKLYSERKIISLGLICCCIARISYAFAFNQWIWIGATAFGSFLVQCVSLINSVISKATPPEIQGSILSGVQSIGSIAGCLGSFAITNIYSFSISSKSPIYFPGTPYLLTSFLLLIAFISSLIIWKKYSNPNSLKNIKKSKTFSVN